MKKMMKLKALMAMGTLLLVLTACENFVTHNRAGEPVSFGASADHKGVATKTAYSGIISGGKLKFVNRVHLVNSCKSFGSNSCTE